MKLDIPSTYNNTKSHQFINLNIGWLITELNIRKLKYSTFIKSCQYFIDPKASSNTKNSPQSQPAKTTV